MTNESAQGADQEGWKTLPQIQAEFAKDSEEMAKAKELASPFLKLKDGEQKEFILTGKITSYMKTFDTSKEAKKMYDFQLAERTSKGVNRVFSVSVKNPVVKELIEAIASGNLRINMKRKGTGNETTYLVMATKP
jgi:hypothetical protein